ncbi:hypothetical protein PGT21_025347 [Puccinia graminis f. sp. tritici]|uniref:Uncharacterized protein n=1 Tax=Puccinia graminis f. sp. tritici TaxID=56615 RepID=A0A5B0PLS2_PUCGR|nr:hypothetical protein PGT21_025347 [Puccinia graminis f. sp. tritici]
MDSPPLFPAGQETTNNPPLGSQPEHYHRPENFIDLTIDEDPLPNQPTNTNPPSENPNRANHQLDNDDDDIIIIGESRPARPPHSIRAPPAAPHQAQPNPSSSSNRPSTSTNSLRNFSHLPGQMATLTADIYAGHYSRHPRGDPTPQPSSSNLTVRETRPPQVRRPASGGVQFGGGGRFSGGQFSGFLAAGLNGLNRLRQLGSRPATPATRRQPPNDSLHDIWAGWGSDDFDRPNARVISAQIRGNLLPLTGQQIFAAIYGFDNHPQPQEPASPPYKVQDSHPLKIKSGFSKEIIPLDREVLSLDSDQPEKQELRPICAGCDAELLIGQDSCSAGSLDGRRPWILACGHVVDSRCLEQAKIRARENKVESHQSKKTRAAERVSNPSYHTRPGRPSKANQAAEGSSKLVHNNNKRRKVSSAHSAPKPPTPSTSPSSTLSGQGVSDSAMKRRERAEAREARKSFEFSKPSTSSQFLESLQTVHSPDKSSSSTLPTNTSSSKNCKGKGKAKEEPNPLPSPEDLLSITIPPTPTLFDKSSTIGNPTLPTDSKLSTKLPKGSSASFVSWIKCPVKGCRGAKGDLLAPPGSQNAPWEMFV